MPGDLQSTYLRLRTDSSIEALPADSFWPRLMRGELGDFHHEYLVTCFTFTADWPSWERHPLGDEIVCLVAGSATLVLEHEGGAQEISLALPGEFALVPRGIWHTGKVQDSATLLFITAGEGTENRPVASEPSEKR